MILLLIVMLVLNINAPADEAARIQDVWDEGVENLYESAGVILYDRVTICVCSDHAVMSYSTVFFGTAIVRIEIGLPVYWEKWMLFHEMAHVLQIQLYNYREDYLPVYDGTCALARDIYAITCPGEAMREGFVLWASALLRGYPSPLLDDMPEYATMEEYNGRIPVEVAAALSTQFPRTIFWITDMLHPKVLTDYKWPGEWTTSLTVPAPKRRWVYITMAKLKTQQ